MDRQSKLFASLSLFATFNTAISVSGRIAARRAGMDPSEQEPENRALRRFEEDRAEAANLVRVLDRSLARRAVGGDDARMVHAFQDRIRVARLTDLLRSMHQRLLSLYPAVSETSVENARQAYRAVEELNGVSSAEFSDRAEAALAIVHETVDSSEPL